MAPTPATDRRSEATKNRGGKASERLPRQSRQQPFNPPSRSAAACSRRCSPVAWLGSPARTTLSSKWQGPLLEPLRAVVRRIVTEELLVFTLARLVTSRSSANGFFQLRQSLYPDEDRKNEIGLR